MQIKLIEKLSKEDADHLFHWRDRVFPEEGIGLEWAQSTWHILAFRGDDKPCGHIGYGEFSILCDGETEQSVVGVGGVVVRPEDQGKNIPSQLFEFLRESAHANSISTLFVLFCPKNLEAYYQKHGYIKFDGRYTFLQKGLITTSDDFALMCYGDSISACEIHINGELW